MSVASAAGSASLPIAGAAAFAAMGGGGDVVAVGAAAAAAAAAGAGATDVPFWGVSDSNVRWCEIDYAVTPYVAEFWNSVSSLFLIVLGIAGLHMCHTHGVRMRRLYGGFVLLAFTGVGSCLFHMTNRYWAQCLDELPMMYGNFVLLSLVIESPSTLAAPLNFTAKSPTSLSWSSSSLASPRSPALSRSFSNSSSLSFSSMTDLSNSTACPWYSKLFSISATVVTLIYFFLPQFYWIFLATYGGCVVIIVVLSIKRACCDASPLFPSSALRLPRRLMVTAYVCYIFGLVCWITENTLCPPTPDRDTSEQLVLTLNRIQLHSWWHIFASLGTYLWLQFQVAFAAVCRLGPGTETTLHYSLAKEGACSVIAIPHVRINMPHRQ